MQPIAQFSFLENVTFLARARVAQVVSLQAGDFAFSPLHIFIFAGMKIDGIHSADEQRDKKKGLRWCDSTADKQKGQAEHM